MRAIARFLTLAFVLLIGFTQILPAWAKAPETGALDAYVQSQISKHGLPGVALTVVQGDQIIYSQGFGTAGSHAMTSQTQMFIGSTSKSFTALSIAQLADRGKIDLYAPVQKYIPWFQIADSAETGKITVMDLLHHTSGLSDGGFTRLLPFDTTPEQAVRALSQAHLTAPVGTRHQYFNLGYAVLGYMVEQVSGYSYADYVQKNIFEPLGMTHTTADPAAASDLAQGNTRLFGFAVTMKQPIQNYEIGAGYIVSTAEDMARYAIAMKKLATTGQPDLLSEDMAYKLFAPGLGSYAMGWYASSDGEKIWHGGANETFRSDLNIYPHKDLAFVLLINEGYLMDHYISAAEINAGVEHILTSGEVPPSQGWSVRWIGWALGILVLGLLVLHTSNFYHLFRGWKERFANMTTAKKVVDVAISFLIPTAILLIVFNRMAAFFGDRFNLVTTMAQFRYSLPDVFILMIAGTLPDYIQGLIKLAWIVSKKIAPAGSTQPSATPAQ